MEIKLSTIMVDHKVKLKNKNWTFIKHFVLITWCFTTIFPILWVLVNAFKSNTQIYGEPFSLPNPIVLKNFPQAIKGIQLSLTLTNSLIYAIVSCTVVVLLSAMVAFYLSKISRSNFLYMYFIIGMMIPIQAVLIPTFINIRNLNLLNSRFGIILIYIATNLAFSIFILTGFMKKGMPDDIIEAAIIDGCGVLETFFLIVLPISKAGIATVCTFVFLGIWNEFLFALLMLSSPSLRTLNLSCYNLRGQYSSDQGLMAAGIIILIIPAIIIYVVFQEQVVKGLTAGAIKG